MIKVGDNVYYFGTPEEIVAELDAEIERLRERVDQLTAELAEVYEDVVRQDGHHIADGLDLHSWWYSQAKSHVCEAGYRLVELGMWERHPDGCGQRQYFRPKPKQEEGQYERS